MTRLLGAILAGGTARRFGADKALAEIDGQPLIARIHATLTMQCDDVIVCGRDRPGYRCIPDCPGPDLGPLGGLAAALHHAEAAGYDIVLTVPCDVPDLPTDLAARLVPAPAFAQDCPVVGLWPAGLSTTLDAFLASGTDRSLRAWARHCAARAAPALALTNINRREDLSAYLGRTRLPSET